MLNKEVEKYFEDSRLNGQHIAVACSAGSDSLALLELIYQFYDPKKITVLHFDHAMRADSHLALEFLQAYCKERILAFVSSKAKQELNSEDDARKARYDFFIEACRSKQIKHLFLAHNLNDNTETLLFRLFRGTSTAGMRGITKRRSVDGIEIHRPFLKSLKTEILDFCWKNSLEFIEDSSNTDERFARNRIRKNILPEALKINPKAIENIDNFSEIILEEQDFINESINTELEKLGELPWQLEKFRQVHRMLQRKILERKFTTSISFVNDFLNAIKEGGFHRINYSKDQFFTIKQKQILLECNTDVQRNNESSKPK